MRAARRIFTPALLLVLAGCGSPPPTLPPSTIDAGAPDAALAAERLGLSSLDALAARGAVDAPLMRELTRLAQAAPRSPEIRADKDLCVRVVFAASGPARVSLADASGTTRGDVATSASGVAPAKGPACISKGETLHVVVEAERSVVVRAVVFGLP